MTEQREAAVEQLASQCAAREVEASLAAADVNEAEILKQMTAQLEAEGMAASEPAFPNPAKMDVDPRQAGPGPQPTIPDHPDWLAQQQPASLPYLRELIQLARESGMSYIRTGNLEMRFDTDNRKPPPGGLRSPF